MGYDITTTYPNNIHQKIYDRSFTMEMDSAYVDARKQRDHHPEALIIITNRGSYVDSLSHEDYKLTEKEMELLRRDPNSMLPDDSIESLKEDTYWTVCVPVVGKLMDEEYTFQTGSKADTKALELSRRNPNTKIRLMRGTVPRRIYLDGEITLDISTLSHHFLEEDTDYFKNASIIWKDLL